MPLTTEVLKKFFDKAIDVGGDIAGTWAKKKIQGSPAPGMDHEPGGVPPSQPKIYLLLMKGQAAYRRLDLSAQSLALGRLNLDPQDASISHQHAEVFFRDGHYWIVDMGSRNGTYLNIARITGAHSLKPGDQIAIGQTVLVFRVDAK